MSERPPPPPAPAAFSSLRAAPLQHIDGCDRTGSVPCKRCSGTGATARMLTCRECFGTGKKTCWVCELLPAKKQ